MDPRGQFRIGQVSRLSGVPPETLRSWEARYQAVRPARTPGGFRLYSPDDVERLKLIRALTDLGNPVGTIANLDAKSLRDRLAGVGSGLSDDQVAAIAIDGGLPESVRRVANALQDLRLAARYEKVGDYRPEFTASLVELESLLSMLSAVGR